MPHSAVKAGVMEQRMSETKPFRYPVWVRGDLDGFFGLMVDNLAQVLLIVSLCKFQAGLPDELIFSRILPGVAISLIIGNLFYGLQAHWAARRYNNPTCTALPYGINTPSVIAYVLFIMGPVYRSTGSSDLAWKAGLLACLVSGVIEFGGAFFAERLRRVTPRAALLGVLAAVGITFIAADFAFRIYTRPLVGVLPLAFLLLAYFARYRFPLGLPGGFLAILFGTVIAWGMTGLGWQDFGAVKMSGQELSQAVRNFGWVAPVFCGPEILTALREQGLLLNFLTVSVPMGVLNVIGSLQNIESAEAGGDRFATAPSLAVNGIGSMAAGLFGSCFPTTIYIGHPGWKALGARAGYSILNGVFFTAIFLFGLGPFIAKLIPIEAGAAIVMYIGIIITAQAFQTTPREHAPAVAISLFPALTAFVVTYVGIYFYANGGRTLAELMQTAKPGMPTEWLPGLVTLTGANSAWIIVTLILTALGAALVDRRYKSAAIWCGVGTVLTALGLLHAYRLEGNDIHELFIWQKAPAEVRVADAGLSDLPAASLPAGKAAVTSVPAGPPTYAYRAFPIAAGYGLATLLLTLVAISSRKAARRVHEASAGAGSNTT
jgi:AGZA family xanthine/uracil permease-like MFS transporter